MTIKEREIYREICHAIEHLENGSVEIALGLLREAKKKEEEILNGDN